jgi:SAM-dependent methyltransferase
MSSSAAWDRAARRAIARPYLDRALAEAKQAAHLTLLDSWLPDLQGCTVLKTDLWEEGVAGDELLFSIATRAKRVIGVDVSGVVVSAAAERARRLDVDVVLHQADVRALPLPDDAVDVVISTSTIDHFERRDDRQAALAELRRVLRADGDLVLTVDNADNAGDPLLRAATAIGALPFPLGPPMTMTSLGELAAEVGFEVRDRTYLVAAPRMVAGGAVRLARLMPRRLSERAVARLQIAFDGLGRRSPRRYMAFVAVRCRAAPEMQRQRSETISWTRR